MFYRRKLILAIIEQLGGEVEKLRFQKLLFLYTMKKQQPEYDFVPYKFGCYSYSARADMNTMVKKGFLSETEKNYKRTDKNSYFQQLKPEDQTLVRETIADHGKMNNNDLLRYTYLSFPFYAINSKIAKDVLPERLYERVKAVIPKEETITLFTIGYEGISLEKYLLTLIHNNVKLLADVRKNPLSMKFGFSKTLLKRYCNSLDIKYVHIPEVGISSDRRRELKTQADYDKLFVHYRQSTLNETSSSQERIFEFLKKHKRIALTCFEAEPCQCHRSHLAASISRLPAFNYPIIHL